MGVEQRTGSNWSLPFSQNNLKILTDIMKEININGGKAEIIHGNVIRITGE